MTESSTLFFKPPLCSLWDTWIYHRGETFYLYYLTRPDQPPDGDRAAVGFSGVGLAISHDGVHWKHHGKVIEKATDVTWLGNGAVSPIAIGDGREKFVMNFSEWREGESRGRQTIFFAESLDLIHWTRFGPEYEFRQDARWYDSNGRWDNIWPVRRAGGGYYGYWAGTPKNHSVGLGFGESVDGITWSALEPPVLMDVPEGPYPHAQSPEVAAVYLVRDKYYALAGLDDLEPQVNADFTDFRPGHTTFVADAPEGPFHPAPKNRRVLVGNASYFLRFVDTPDGALANHHSWEIIQGRRLGVDDSRTYLAPLKRAKWDEEGTLRLKWWEGNEKAKSNRFPVESQLLDTAFDLEETLILEGEMTVSSSVTGLYLQGTGGKGTGFLVRNSGHVEYGDIDCGGTHFKKRGAVDRECASGGQVSFRLVRKGRITEFYLNDVLMQCYCLPERGTGRIGLIGSAHDFYDLQAWYCT